MKSKNSSIMLAVLALTVFGIIMVFSASSVECGMAEKYHYDSAFFLKRQVIYAVAGLAGCIMMQKISTAFYYHAANVIYVGSIACIFLLKTSMGVAVNGATRWLNLGPFQFQVAEVVKIGMIILEAAMIRKNQHHMADIKVLARIWMFGVGTAILLYGFSNDLSSSLILLLITFANTFIFMKFKKMHILIACAGIAVVALYVVWFSKHLPDPAALDDLQFRTARVAAWLAPEKYAKSAGYQTLQALYAIASGGWLGRGLGQSLQKLGSIPEAQNDMIFSIICEELGAVGVVVLLFLFTYLLYYLLKSVFESKDLFDAALAIGVFVHIAAQTFINIAVNVNLLPNTGIALPFISYGGTAILCQILEIGFVLKVNTQGEIAKAKLEASRQRI